jgi:hypothetical protein
MLSARLLWIVLKTPDGLLRPDWPDHGPCPIVPKRLPLPTCATRACVRGILIYCSDYKCSHLITMSGDRWLHDMRLSDLGPRFTC